MPVERPPGREPCPSSGSWPRCRWQTTTGRGHAGPRRTRRTPGRDRSACGRCEALRWPGGGHRPDARGTNFLAARFRRMTDAQLTESIRRAWAEASRGVVVYLPPKIPRRADKPDEPRACARRVAKLSKRDGGVPRATPFWAFQTPHLAAPCRALPQPDSPDADPSLDGWPTTGGWPATVRMLATKR